MSTTLFNKLFQEHLQGIPKQQQDVQNNYFSLFEKQGWPTSKWEEWRYFNFSSLLASIEQIALTPGTTTIQVPQNSQNVTIQKKSIQDLNSSHTQNPLALVGQAFAQEEWVITIPKDTVLLAPIIIAHHPAQNSLYAPQIHIVLEKNAQALVVEDFQSTQSNITSGLTKIDAAGNSQLHYLQIQNQSPLAFHFQSLSIAQKAHSHVYTTTLALGGQKAKHNLDIILEEAGAFVQALALSHSQNDQFIAHHSNISHKAAHCQSNQLYKYVLDDQSQSVFDGKIIVSKGAIQSNASQLNRSLILNPNASANTKPQLEIDNDDVKCSHGATIGQLNSDELFYLESRGINPSQARQLLSQGFAQDILEQIASEELRSLAKKAYSAVTHKESNA